LRNKLIRQTFFALWIPLELFIALVCFYFLCIVTFSPIKVNTDAKEGKVPMYLLSNGVHTDLVLPVSTSIVNWEHFFPFENTRGKIKEAKWIAFGWGDKGFYLNTPTWGDLTFATAFKSTFGLSSSALHVTYYDSIKKSNLSHSLRITEKDYLQLVKFIQQTMIKNGKEARWIPTNAVYSDFDAFYDANGTYNMFYNCNTWVINGLNKANQQTCFWTPLSDPILRNAK